MIRLPPAAATRRVPGGATVVVSCWMNHGWSCEGGTHGQALAVIEWRLDSGQLPVDAKHTRRGLDQRVRERAMPGHLGWRDFWHDADAGQPDVDNLDRTVRKHMAVFCLVERLEGGKHLRHGGAVQRAAGKGHAQLVALANIAQITRPCKGHVARGNAIGLVLRDQLRLHGRKVGVQAQRNRHCHWS